jgi:hypothetical protein
MTRRAWAWRILPFEARLDLVFTHQRPRGSQERLAWAQMLRDWRKKHRG